MAIYGEMLSAAAQDQLTSDLLEGGFFGVAEREEDYITLKSGVRSPHYFNVREGITFDEDRDIVVNAFVSMMHNQAMGLSDSPPSEYYDRVAGSPEATTAYGTLVSRDSKVPLLQPRVGAKATGNKSPILGKYEPGMYVALLDDVITDGATKIEMIEAISAAGLNVADYFVMLDREEQGGTDRVKEETGVEVTAALTASGLVAIALKLKMINQTQFDNVARYMEEHGSEAAKERLAD